MLQRGSRVEFVPTDDLGYDADFVRGTILEIRNHGQVGGPSWVVAVVDCDDGCIRYPREHNLKLIGVLDKLVEALDEESD